MITMAQKQRNIPKGTRTKQISVVIPIDLYNFIKEYCKEEEVSQALYFNELLTREKNAYEQKKSLN